MGLTNIIDIDWTGLFKPIPGLRPNVSNRIRINREVIPIIFVPGIMGSRLTNRSGESVWDPDRPFWCMLRKYGGFWNTPAKRKRMLIGEVFDAGYLRVDEDDPKHNRKFHTHRDAERAGRGWGGIYWGSYGDFLEQLQNHKWDAPIDSETDKTAKEVVGICFEFPVHAFGYNWTDTNLNSGAALAARIVRIKDWYKSKGRLCKYVILISHSMGGLVCRSACMLHDAGKDVLGVIHGVQPATGAAAAYWRMKAGFERVGKTFPQRLLSKVSAWVLGTNGEEVTCILGNAPGGLELLPNRHYTDNNGEHGWLRVPGTDGNDYVLPRHGDPYNEIYKVKTNQFWRLINPDWLNPRDKLSPPMNPFMSRGKAWNKYIVCITMAEKFHQELQTLCHKNTYQFHSCSVNTVDNIRFSREVLSFSGEIRPAFEFEPVVKKGIPIKKPTSRGSSIMYVDDYDREIPPPVDPSATYVLSMSRPDDHSGGGDGTVPDSSGNALKDVLNTHALAGVEHQEAYLNSGAIEYIFRAVRSLALKRIKESELAP